MVHKRIIVILTLILFASCQKEELISYTSSHNETTTLIEQTENPDTPKVTTNLDATLNWIHSQQQENGLLTSSDYIDFVSLYDNALAAILYIQNNEQTKAEKVLDFFKDRLQSEFEMEIGGFYQFRNSAGENGSRRWLGDNAWLLIATHHYKRKFASNEYDLLSQKLEEWIRLQQNADGSLIGGTNEDGSDIPIVTEGIITAFNAVPGYDDFHKNILNYLEINRWDASLQNFMAWPENEAYVHALDVFTLSQGIFEDFPIASLIHADEKFLTSQIATVSGNEISGYCFDEDKDVIWLEGSAQMAVALQTNGSINRSNEIVAQIEKSFIQSVASENAKGIPYAANHGTSYGSSILWNHADLAPALSSTIWYQFAKMGFNPLLLGRDKNLPDSDKFWLLQEAN